MPYIFTRSFGAARKFKPKLPKDPIKWKRWLKRAGMAFLVLALLGVLTIAGVFIYFAKDLPSSGEVNSRRVAESTKIFDRTGEHLLYDIHGEEKRTVIDFGDMPANVKFATLALEDQDFYTHHGVKFSAIARAALRNVFGGSYSQGGSTITQQLVKNTLLTTEKTYTRKIKELILSLELERKFEKNDILGMYLNEIPYGSNAYGIEAAAQTFFNKHARDLTLDESALLASLPQAPSYYSPIGSHTDELKWRQEHALDTMAQLGYISQQEADDAKKVDVLAKIEPQIEDISAPHFVMYVRDYLEEKYGAEAVETGGFKVYTTLDWDMQQTAERVVREGAEKNLKNWNAENAALVAIDPKTGQILSMVGSKDFFDKEIDGQVNVAIRDRQPGSSIKPFVYLTAFTKGYLPETILFDVQTNFDAGPGQDKYTPQNYTGEFHGPMKIQEALGQSLNIPAVKTLYLAGVKDSITLAKSLGITTLNQPERYGLSLVLGGGEVKLLDHTLAYATLADGGVRHDKTAILRIERSDGSILERFTDSPGVRVVDEKYVAMLDSIISNNAFRAPAFGEQNPLRFDKYPVAAKTGTTNEFRDGWTMGYSTAIAVGVWAGNNDNSEMRVGAAGANIAGPIWHAFMEDTLPKLNNEDFPKLEDIEKKEAEESGEKPKEELSDEEKKAAEEQENEIKKEKGPFYGELQIEKDVKVCEIPGEDGKYCKANKYCPDDKEKKKDFANVHTILYYVNREDPAGPKPENPNTDPQYEEWEKAVKEYYKGKDDFIYGEYPEEECKEDDFKKYKPELSISVPGSTSSNQFTIEAKSDAPYGIDSVKFYVEGEKVGEKDNKSSKVTYTVPDSQNHKTLTVRVELKDDNGNTVEEEERISVSF